MIDYVALRASERAANEARWAAMSDAERIANDESHYFGYIDGVHRCRNCEVGSWNAWKYRC